MGSGIWSPSTYNDRVAARSVAGTDTFDYSNKAIQSGNLRPHQTLDPQGLQMRESRDSAEHPTSNSIIISLDVTGSMGKVCRGIHDDLPQLHELLLGHRYIPDPQILFGAVGDATCDQVPLQVGQFESDNRMDQNLENMILEGGGGGQKTESYELMLYVAARHTATDCWDKRRHKGYLFMIGDEMPYPFVKAAEVNRVMGEALQADIPLQTIVDEVKQRYHVYFIIPGGASYGSDQQVLGYWTQLMGADRVIKLDTPEDTSESIGLTIGINEGAITLNDGVAQMQRRGVVGRAIDRISKALTGVTPAGPTVKPDRPRRL
ncbi:MAG TPA: hypothetical protein VFE47_20220 [Tepidisphaeraceae bacterium]|jgi:hypothetical protein|nr:hypothetical protein [Tepidisphaeraceae bacterium]